MKQWFLIACIVLGGCTTYSQPVDIATLPNDCANKDRILNWLEGMANLPKHTLESPYEYEKTRRTYRHKIWHLKYTCNAV